ncbi:unnamed protein product [Boreogadus saida]
MATSDSVGTFQGLIPKPPLPVQSLVSDSWFHRLRRLSVLCQGPLLVTVGEPRCDGLAPLMLFFLLVLQTSHEGERVTPLLLARGTAGGRGCLGGLARFPY